VSTDSSGGGGAYVVRWAPAVCNGAMVAGMLATTDGAMMAGPENMVVGPASMVVGPWTIRPSIVSMVAPGRTSAFFFFFLFFRLRFSCS